MSSFRAFLTTQLQATAELARRQFGQVTANDKSGDHNQVLTETDLAIGRQLIAAIEATYPDHNIIDEEAGVLDRGSRFTWVIDPIDGTSNFANGVPTYGTMLGLLDGDTPIAGGLSLPSFDQLYIAEKGQGTECNGHRVHVTTETNLLKCLVAYGIDGHQEAPQLTHQECRQLARLVLAIRNLRSSNSVFDIAQLVTGRYGAALNRTSKIWDNVAQQIVIEEAGGVYTSITGQAMDYRQPLTQVQTNYTYCAAAPTLHSTIIKLLNQEES